MQSALAADHSCWSLIGSIGHSSGPLIFGSTDACDWDSCTLLVQLATEKNRLPNVFLECQTMQSALAADHSCWSLATDTALSCNTVLRFVENLPPKHLHTVHERHPFLQNCATYCYPYFNKKYFRFWLNLIYTPCTLFLSSIPPELLSFLSLHTVAD